MKRFVLTSGVLCNFTVEEVGYFDTFCLVDREEKKIYKWYSGHYEIPEDITKVVVKNYIKDDKEGRLGGIKQYCTNDLYKLMYGEYDAHSYKVFMSTDDEKVICTTIDEWKKGNLLRLAKSCYIPKRLDSIL